MLQEEEEEESGSYLEPTSSSAIEHMKYLEGEPEKLLEPLDLTKNSSVVKKDFKLQNVCFIGKGHFGSVYSAKNCLLKGFALKCIDPKFDDRQYLLGKYLNGLF